uniref:Clr5 domain-containing protein n=1 Tax=Strongyloides papillosus TaxID=174720 RepID=A0A0N5BI91_STREA
MEDITLWRSDRLAIESLLVTLRTLKESESWSEEELERLAIQKFWVLQRYNLGSKRLIEECRKILKSVKRSSANSEKKVDSKKRKKRSNFSESMSASKINNIAPVTTTAPGTPIVTIAGSQHLPFVNTPIATGVGSHQIPLLGTPMVAGLGGYQTPYGMNNNKSSYVEKIPEEDWGDVLWLSLEDQIREEIEYLPESVKTNYISLKATLMEKFATHLEAKQSRMEADVYELNFADGEKLMKS